MRLRFPGIGLLILMGLGCSSWLGAQDRPYHIEFTEANSVNSHQPAGLRWVIFVNDSKKTVEAFALSAKCGTAGRASRQDPLDNPPGSPIHPYDGKPHQTGLAPPGAHALTLFSLIPQRSGCEWKVNVSTVVYADGSYDGPQDDVRRLQAYREGILDGVHYWVRSVNAAGDDETWLTAARNDATNRLAQDQAKSMYPGCGRQTFACVYWQGRLQADTDFSINLRRNDAATALRGIMRRMFERWETAFAKDTAFTVMENTIVRSEELPIGESQ